MNKFQAVCVSVLLSMSSLALAATDKIASGYYTSQHNNTAKTGKQAAFYRKPTDVRVTNYTPAPIIITVPGTPISDSIQLAQDDHVQHDYQSQPVRVVLYDGYGVFWDGVVCRWAMLDVTGMQRPYNVNIDTRFC